MVAQPGIYQATNNAGELAPELYGRTDIKQYYAGLTLAKNVEPVPQGGSRLSPRGRFRGRVRRQLVEIPPASSAITLGPFSAAAQLAIITFSTTAPLSVVSLPGFTASQAIGMIVRAEYQDRNGNWQPFGGTLAPPVTKKNCTFAREPGKPVQARGVRIMLGVPPSATTFTLPEVHAFKESAVLATGLRLRPFTFALDQTYMAAITDDVTDFWRDGVWVGAARLAWSTIEQIKAIDTLQRLDTMLLFHSTLITKRIMREGSDSVWNVDDVPFTNVPNVDLGGTYTNQVLDAWQLTLTFPSTSAGSGILVSVSANGNAAPVVNTGAPDFATFAVNLKASLESLPGVAAGVVVNFTGATTTQANFDIQFPGANLGKLFLLSAAATNTGQAAALVSHVSIGKPGGEHIESDARGYAAAATFYQDRLVKGGFASKGGAWLASATGDYFNLNIDATAVSGAMLINLDTDGAEQIQRIIRSRFLVFFTSDAEYFVSDRALSKAATPNIVNSSRIGSAPHVPVVENEGAIMFMAPDKKDPERKGKLLYEATFDAISEAYTARPISLLASHIVAGVTGMALQRGEAATDASRLWMTRADGTMAVGVMIRGQEVTAFVRWETGGQVLDVAVDGLNRPFVAVRRIVDGAPEIHLESLELGLIFDGTLEQTFGQPTTIVTGLDMHEGASVWVQADGYVDGPFVVRNGQITLNFAARHVLAGRWTAPDARLLPLPTEVGDRIVLRRPRRVFAVKLDLIGTTSVAIGANDEAAEDVPLFFAGQAVDVAPAPFTGEINVDGLVGWSAQGIVQVTQVRPGTLQWRSSTTECTMPR